jgi:anti-anti-sigma regulatory factor/TolA-binding protein
MSKEAAPVGGLLSKVVRFVRSPGGSVGDSVTDDVGEEGPYSKQMLKEMLERKRNNDQVRKREFDQLRQIRERQMLQGQVNRLQDPAVRPSFFQSSMASPDERAVTLKKIDEIEAQMSQQWWKSKQGSVNATAPAPTVTAGPVPTVSVKAQVDAQPSVAAEENAHLAFAPTMPSPGVPPRDSALTPVAPLFPNNSMAVEGFGTVDAKMLAEPDAETLEPAEPVLNPIEIAVNAIPVTGPEPPPEPEVFVHEPELEEAAILFANADYDGAEAGLRDVLARYPQGGSDEAFEIWMTLFDLLRATGQQQKFEPLAIDYASRYGRSAPVWFSMPDQLGLVEVSPEEEAMAARKFNWSSPPNLAVSTMAALHALLQRSASPWTLSWGRITGIDSAAVPLLADEFTQWADRTGEFVFSGADRLHAVLEGKTQAGDRSGGPEWWRLRMAAMRLMGRPDDFEMVALDYCVTYEVSPPSWVAPKCVYSDDSSKAVAPEAPPARDWMATDYGALSVPAPLEVVPTAKLTGHIDGDATPLLEPFEAYIRPNAPLVVNCEQLIRMDFAAAGSVLNWAAEQQAKGAVVHFQQLQRLVAVLLNVIGVNEHARVIPRKN